MKTKKSYLLICLLTIILMLSGCARTDETIDVNYWRYKLKKPSSGNLLDSTQNITQGATNKGADATEDLYNMLGGKVTENNGGLFSDLADSFTNQIKLWGQEGLDTAITNDQSAANTQSKEETSVLQTTIVEDAKNAPNGRIQVTLDRVVDGDTFLVIYKDALLRVRLIGINTPESVHSDDTKNTPEGVAASDFVKELLSDVSIIWLEFDQDTEDDYGRTLAYAWLNETGKDIEADLINGIILKSGHAETMTIEPNIKYVEQLAAVYPTNKQ